MVDLKELQRLRDAAILHEAENMAENDMWAKELREEIALMVPAIIAELTHLRTKAAAGAKLRTDIADGWCIELEYCLTGACEEYDAAVAEGGG